MKFTNDTQDLFGSQGNTEEGLVEGINNTITWKYGSQATYTQTHTKYKE